MKFLISLLLTFSLIGLNTVRADQNQPSKIALDVAEANNLYGHSTFGQIIDLNPQKNILFSPLGASLALSLLVNGSQGQTLNQLEKALHIEKISLANLNSGNSELIASLTENKGDEKLYIANSLWGDSRRFTFLQPYLKTAQPNYRAELRMEDFSQTKTTLNDINQWVSKATNKLIPKLLEKLDPNTVALLLNALFFEGKWKLPFTEKLTRDANFLLEPAQRGAKASTVKVKMMNPGKPLMVDYGENDQVQYISLPFMENAQKFQPGRFALDIYLPKKAGNIAQVARQLSSSEQSKIRQNSIQTFVIVEVPKFKFEFMQSLKPVLMKQGVVDVFAKSADLSALGRSSGGDLYVQDVLQKTAVEMNEFGFKAAASTAVVIGERGIIRTDKTFTADHPFMIVLRDTKTDTALFEGLVVHPTWQ